MQLINQNIIKAIFGISLVFAAGAFLGSFKASPATIIMNIRKLYDTSISYFEEERSQRSEPLILIKKPTPTQSPTPSPAKNNSPEPTASPTASQTITPTPIATPTPTPASTPTPTPTQRPVIIPSPTSTTRRTSTP